MKRYDELLSRVVTAFYLPSYAVMDIHESPYQKRTTWREPEYQKQMDLLRAIPFPCIRIIRDGEPPPNSDLGQALFKKTGHRPKRLTSDIVCEVRDGLFWWAGKDSIVCHDGWRQSKYMPEDWDDYGVNAYYELSLPRNYFDLMHLLADRQNRYVENRLSRQVRRAAGVSPTYCEYIIVRKKEAPLQEAYRWSEIVRRHPILHAVRAHLRHYQSGMVVKVRAHSRGHGELFQVKDYRVPAT